MPYKDIDIQQAIATAESKLSLKSYSSFLKRLYSSIAYCRSNEVGCLLLLRFALSKWDNREGAFNAYDETGLTRIIRQINQL